MAKRTKAQSPYRPYKRPANASPSLLPKKPAANLEGIDQPWYAAFKAAVHATPEQHAAAAESLAKRNPWDEIPKKGAA